MFCQKCGSKISNDSNYCGNCRNVISIAPHGSPWMLGADLQQKSTKENIGCNQPEAKIATPTRCTQPIGESQILSKSQIQIKWLIPIIIIATVVIALTILFATATKCDNCGDYLWGKGHKYWVYNVCEECWHQLS